MTERPWMPSDEEIHDAYDADGDVGEGEYPHIEALIVRAVEQAVAEQANLADTWRKKASDMATRHAVDLERARLEAKIEAIKEWGSHSHKEWDHYKWESCVLCRETQQLQQQIAALKEKP